VWCTGGLVSHQSPLFQEEFPSLAQDDKSKEATVNQPTKREEEIKDTQYGPGPSLRPQSKYYILYPLCSHNFYFVQFLQSVICPCVSELVLIFFKNLKPANFCLYKSPQVIALDACSIGGCYRIVFLLVWKELLKHEKQINLFPSWNSLVKTHLKMAVWGSSFV